MRQSSPNAGQASALSAASTSLSGTPTTSADASAQSQHETGSGQGFKTASLAQHLRILCYSSFRHAQGSQVTQLHFLQSYARFLVELGVPFDAAAFHGLSSNVVRHRLPTGHLHIPEAQKRAQFAFWALNIWSIVCSVYRQDPGLLPDGARIEHRRIAVRGSRTMTSFTSAEMGALNAAFAIYRDPSTVGLAAAEVVTHQFLPALIDTELGFQGRSHRYPFRPRTDRGDVHESRMLLHCRTALRQYHHGQPGVTDRIYAVVCSRLDELSRPSTFADPVAKPYNALVVSYNLRHPDSQVGRLHVPVADFPRHPLHEGPSS